MHTPPPPPACAQCYAPMTPPHSDAVQHKSLPDAYLHAHHHPRGGQLLTPPDDTPPVDRAMPQQPPQPASYTNTNTNTNANTDTRAPQTLAPPPLDWTHDWLHVSRARPESAQLVAEKTCEMICYLWFAPAIPSSTSTPSSSLSAAPLSNGTTTAPTPLQLHASPTFVTFTQKLLETTQLSQSAIVLALHYIFRLRERNRATPAQAGSEFRVAVAGLMMANKFLDDNTYTNATWSAVSLIPLPEINRMEREFLLGVDYSLFVGERVYGDWLRLLKGLVGARRACRVGGRHQEGRARRVQGQVGQGQRRRRSASPRRRWGGGSPVRPVQVKQEPVAYSVKQEEQDVAMDAYVKAEPADDYAGAGCKRRAVAAFSPPSYHPPQVRCPPAFPPLASALGSQQQQYAVRPAPTLVIPSHSSSTSTSQAASAYPSSSSSSAYPHPSASTSSSVSAYPQSSHPAANGYGVAPLPSFPLSHPSSLAHQSHSSVQQQHSQQSHSHSPLERFGALSLSNGKGTPSPERPSVPLYAGTGTSERGTQRPVGRQRRERPTSWVGPSSGGFGAASATYLQDRGRATFPYAGETYPMPGSYSRPRTPPTARYQPPAPTATYAQHSQYAPRYAEQGYGNEEQQQEVTTRYGEQEPKPYSAPQTLTARYEYDHAAAAGRGIQDLYFYTLASSPVSSSSTSSSVSSSGSSGSCSPSSNSNSYSDDEDEEEGEDEDMEAYEAEERREEERRREDERRREAERERGRAARLRVAPAYAPYQQQQQKPAQGVAFGVSSSTPFNCNANNGTTATSTTNSIHALSINTSGGTGLGGGGVRWGVQSARTSPVRWPAPPVYPTYNTLPTTTITASSSATHANTNTRSTTAAVAANAYATQQQQQQWTPPRPAYAPASQWTPPRIGVGAGGAEWTPPRMHVGGERVGGGLQLPRFADVERWSLGGVYAVPGAALVPSHSTPSFPNAPAPPGSHPSSQAHYAASPASYASSTQQARTTHTARPQPRRAVFANAGPPGVSGYAYAY